MTAAELIDLRKAMDEAERHARLARQPAVKASQAELRARCVELWQAEKELPETSEYRVLLDLRQREAETAHNSLLAQVEYQIANIRRNIALRTAGPLAGPSFAAGWQTTPPT